MYTERPFPFFPDSEPDIVEHALCHGCGLCTMVCPSNALSLDGLRPVSHAWQKNPAFNPDLCLHCGRCSAVCPSDTLHQVRFATLLNRVRQEHSHTVIFFCSNLQALMAPEHTQDSLSDPALARTGVMPSLNKLKLPEGVLFESLRCTSRVGARLIDRLVLAGVSRVMLFSGPTHLCHYNDGLCLADTQSIGLSSVYEAYGIEAYIHTIRWVPTLVEQIEERIARFVTE